MNTNFNKLRKIAPDIVKVYNEWYDAKVIWLNDEKKQHFVFEKVITKSISSMDIIGSTHFGYLEGYNPSWIQYLENLSRMDMFLRHDIDYIIKLIRDGNELEPDKKRVIEINGKYFIDRGNHRLTLAKFLNLASVEIDVHVYKHKDDTLIDLY